MSKRPLASGRATRTPDGNLHITMVAPAITPTGTVPLAATCTCTGWTQPVTTHTEGEAALQHHITTATQNSRRLQSSLF